MSAAGVTAVADVRSTPWSGRSPWFNQDAFAGELEAVGMEYRFLGQELGGRPRSPVLYRNGTADYTAMAKEPKFIVGLQRVISDSQDHDIALLCSERDPLHCHRCLLVSRALAKHDIDTLHLDHLGGAETQREVEERLLREEGMWNDDAMPLNYRLETAYEKRRQRVAFSPSGIGEQRVGVRR
jgi:uncharacterized protein (DUF488 family)